MSVGDYDIRPFAGPVAGVAVAPERVRGNDETIRQKFVAHQADAVAHVTSGTAAERPVTGSTGQLYLALDTGAVSFWDGAAWQSVGGGGGSVTLSTVSIAFTDGDTARRTTVTDASVTSTSTILLSIMRPTTADSADPGFLYTANVISRGAGTFDVLVNCLDLSGEDPSSSPPNETITLVYTVS